MSALAARLAAAPIEPLAPARRPLLGPRPPSRALRWYTADVTRERRADWVMGGGLAGAAAALYALTLCRGPYWYDSAEYVTAAVTLGIPHPPGYPLYTLLAHVFTWLPFDPATAVNAMSATCAAATVALAFALVRELGGHRSAAAVAAGLLAAGHVFWANALIAEVYTPALAVLLGVTLLVVRGTRQRRARPVIFGAGLAGLGLGIHLSIATCGLGLALLVAGHSLPLERGRDLALIVSRRSLRQRAAVAAGAAVATALGSCVFLYLPLRAAMKPALNFGDPSSWNRFLWHVTGGNYKHWFDAPEPFVGRAAYVGGLLADQLSVPGLALAAAGLALLGRRRPLVAAAFALMMSGNLWFFFDYRVHDVEVFFLPTSALLAICAGLGVDAVVQLLRRALPDGRAVLALARVAALAVPALMVVGNYRTLDMSTFDDAAIYGDMMTAELPANAVIADFTTPPEWKLNAVFGYYFQLVHGARPDVAVITSPPPAQLAALVGSGRPVYLYFPLEMIGAGSFVVEKEPSQRHARAPECEALEPDTGVPLPHCARWRITGLRPRPGQGPAGVPRPDATQPVPPAGPPAAISGPPAPSQTP